MKNWSIKDIEKLEENEAKSMALESMTIKEHNIYFVDFGDAFGYSCLVFKNNHSIYYANDYELLHSGMTQEELKDFYIKKMNQILFTEAELAEPIKDYDEAQRKHNFLHNYYGMQVDRVSIFGINPTDKEKAEFKEQTEKMTYNPVAFAYMYDAEFVKHHIELQKKVKSAERAAIDDYEYQKNAFLSEMYNHEYGINWQADYDTLSAFGHIGYHDNDLDAYFEELHFTPLQRRAYLDAREQYYKEAA